MTPRESSRERTARTKDFSTVRKLVSARGSTHRTRRRKLELTVSQSRSLRDVLLRLVDCLESEHGAKLRMDMDKPRHHNGPGSGALVIVVARRGVELHVGGAVTREHLIH